MYLAIQGLDQLRNWLHHVSALNMQLPWTELPPPLVSMSTKARLHFVHFWLYSIIKLGFLSCLLHFPEAITKSWKPCGKKSQLLIAKSEVRCGLKTENYSLKSTIGVRKLTYWVVMSFAFALEICCVFMFFKSMKQFVMDQINTIKCTFDAVWVNFTLQQGSGAAAVTLPKRKLINKYPDPFRQVRHHMRLSAISR